MSKRGTFGSRFGVVAAVGGSVIGLGNIWRFPYITGENGGAAFIIIYLLVSFLISIPVMLTEFSIGRSTRRNAKRAFSKLAPGSKWPLVGYLGIITALVILSFYCVIAGWSLEFLKESVLNRFAGRSSAEIQSSFESFVASGWRPIIWTAVFALATGWIVMSGIEKGIERYTKILMPMFVLMLVGLAVNSFTLDGAREGISFLLKPDFSKISLRTALVAMGQSFFSMSLGMGAMITYGSYIKKNENMFKVAGIVALSDLSVAILSGLAIFPAVFSFGINPSSGPDLVFLTLPNIFARMPGGYIISVVFFILLFIAAITSSISLLEVITAYVTEELQISRKRAVMLAVGVILLMGMMNAMSQMPDSKLRIAGMNLFDFCDSLSSNFMMPFGGLMIVIFAGWRMSPAILKNEMTSNMRYGLKLYPVVRFVIKFIAPIVIAILLIQTMGILST